eukprot:TRINITY_DN2980_c0_g1_i1.p1 TRINITY_DN2980_c0_g1~~TRINITY_DN2980_c0_g1_i1.p1  ORF type:complete len:348 (+),score=110.10 TRINITY_DN2980_c0_g1_i1:135-1178(+)
MQYFDDCHVPVENVIGEVGGGFKIAMRILNNGRFGIGAGASANIRNVIRLASEHATTRKQFGTEIKNFGLIQEKFAKMAVNAYAIESMTYATTGMIDGGVEDCSVEAACCKVFGSEALFTAINEGLQVMGGMGFMAGSYPFERMLRDSRILSIFEGTNEILRLFIGLSGCKEPGDRLKELSSVRKNMWTQKSMKTVTDAIMMRAKRTWSPQPLKGAHSKLKNVTAKLEAAVNQHGLATEFVLFKYGKDIMDPKHQMQVARLANSAIDLYALATSISRCSESINHGAATAEHEIKLVNALGRQTLGRIRMNRREIYHDEKKNGDKDLMSIANDVFAKGEALPSHPLGL